MSRQRRQRLEAVIHPLVDLDCFSSEQAKAHCSGTSPSHVSRLLRQLVRDGLLRESKLGGNTVYQWQRSKPPMQEARRWIDRQVCEARSVAPPRSRVRERLLRCGANSLSDAELLSVLVRVALTTEPAMEVGQRIANQFSLHWRELADATLGELRDIAPAMTRSSYTQIMAGIELGRRIALADRPYESVEGITSTDQAIEFCRQAFRRLAFDGVQEEFHLVTLDTKHKPIGTHQVTVGTLDAALVHPREVFRPAIRHAAAAVLLVHNHPSGDPKPSREDQLVTQQLTEAGKLLGIQVLDHIVVARSGCVSVRELAS
ncbi:MAG: DNA repair protein RadC [Rubripirellula sp.]|nr:DNA repair protein RadC [Rubripirellula sp.]